MNNVAVCIPIFGMTRYLRELVSTLILSVNFPNKIVLIDDNSEDLELSLFLANLNKMNLDNLEIVVNAENIGYLKNVNRVIRKFSNDDIVIINSDVLVDQSWFERIRRVAASDNTIATISVWASNGTLLTIAPPEMNESKLSSQLADINKRIEKFSLLEISIPVAVGHLIYLRREPLNLIGEFSEIFGLGYGEEVDYSLRAMKLGFRNVVATRIFVAHRGAESSIKTEMSTSKQYNDALICEIYPFYQSYLDELSPRVNSVKEIVKKWIYGIEVGIDASCLAYPMSGTSQITLAIINQFSQLPEYNVTVLLEKRTDDEILLNLLGNQKISVAYFTDSNLVRFDIIWRPYQNWEEDRLTWIIDHSEIFVLGIQDFIAFDNVFYHSDAQGWMRYRESMKKSISKASAVTYISQYTFHRARELGLLNSNKNLVVPNGVNHLKHENKNMEKIHDTFNVLLLGHDFPHKNYLYALKLMESFALDGNSVRLIHIGKPSQTIENWKRDSEITFAIEEMGELVESEKSKILNEIDLALYLSTVEGFGLVPFELAFAGIPTLFAPQGGLAEFIPNLWDEELSWNIETDKNRLRHLKGKMKSQRAVSQVLDAAIELTWENSISLFEEMFRCLLGEGLRINSSNPMSPLDSSLSKSTTVVTQIRIFLNRILPVGTLRRKVARTIYMKLKLRLN